MLICVIAVGCAGARLTPISPRQVERAQSAPADEAAGYHTYDELSTVLRQIAARGGSAATLETIATTVSGRAVSVLTLSSAGEAATKQAILIVGGIDAARPASSETALNVAKRLVDAVAKDADGPAAKLLADHTLYIVPRVNPDGIETYFEPLKHESPLDARPIDDDRDGVVNEDGPNDLNGDAMITVMRVPDPQGKWMVDPDEPRLLKRADPAKGEHGKFKLMLEGSDDDGDGEINEDGLGGVDDDRNWPHFYEPGTGHTGLHQLSEPQTRGLAQFIVDHPNIAAAIVYGRNDNIVEVPKGKQRGPGKRAYRDLNPGDVELYQHISERFKEITGLKSSGGGSAAGALYAWLYSQQGIPTIATELWRPLSEKKKSPTTAPTSRPSDTKTPDSKPTPASQPSLANADAGLQVFQFRRGGPPPGMRPGGGEGDSSGSKKPADPIAARVESTKSAEQWLKYSDTQRSGAGFVAWTKVSHPTLGEVEVGGFAPYFRTTPPIDALDGIADGQLAFLQELAGDLPRLSLEAAQVADVGSGLWRVELRIRNDGYLPTHTAIARQVRTPPIVIRPQIKRERIVGGRPLERIDNVPGSGGSVTRRWLIRGKRGDAIEFRATNRVYGELRLTVTLEESDSKKDGE